MVLGKGKANWDRRVASKTASLFLSLKNALIAVNKGEKNERSEEVGKRGYSAKLFADLYNALGGEVVPQGGINYNSVKFGLRKLDELTGKTGDQLKKQKLNEQYGKTERGFQYLKPREQVSKPFTMGQSLGVEGEEAGSESADPAPVVSPKKRSNR